MAGRSGAADGSSHFGRTGERYLGNVGVLDQRFAGRTVAGNNVDDSWRQSDFRADLSEGKGGERGKLRRLENHGVARGQSRRNLPGQHEQREIPRDNLTNNAARRVSGKFLMEQLRPAGVVIEMAHDQRDVNVPTLPNRFAIVHRLQHGEAAGVLLHSPRQCIEIARSGVRSESLPFWQG